MIEKSEKGRDLSGVKKEMMLFGLIGVALFAFANEKHWLLVHTLVALACAIYAFAYSIPALNSSWGERPPSTDKGSHEYRAWRFRNWSIALLMILPPGYFFGGDPNIFEYSYLVVAVPLAIMTYNYRKGDKLRRVQSD